MLREATTSAGRAAGGPVDLDRVLDALPAFVAYIDADERNRYTNRAGARWLGLTREDIEGRTVRELLGEAGRALRRRLGYQVWKHSPVRIGKPRRNSTAGSLRPPGRCSSVS